MNSIFYNGITLHGDAISISNLPENYKFTYTCTYENVVPNYTLHVAGSLEPHEPIKKGDNGL